MKPGIDKIRGFGEIQRAYNWGISFVGDTPSWGKAAGINGTTQLHRCNSVQLPDIINTMLEVNIRGVRVVQPGLTKYSGDVVLTFIESESAEVRKMLQAWSKAIFDEEEQKFNGLLIKKDGKKGASVDINVYQLASDNQTVTAKYELRRCFLKNISLGKFGSDNENQNITATISASQIRQIPVGSVEEDNGGRSYAKDIIDGIANFFS